MLDNLFRNKFVEDFFSGVEETENLQFRRIKAIKRRDAEGCNVCGYPMWAHDKERVNYGGGQYSYDYECPSKADLFA